MSWTKGSWTDLIGTDGTKTTIASGATETGDIDCNGANPFIVVAVKVVVVFGGSPDDDITIEFFGKDADDAAEVDTLAIFEASIPEQTSSEERATYQINVSALDTLQVSITNNDSADSVDVWVEYMGAYQ
jgi:hypothetical protein